MKFYVRRFRASLVAVLLAGWVSAQDRPNLVWIVSDDLSPELGCYGYEGVATPNIDRLASEGVRYTHAFATAPVCSSSRSAFITGVYQTTTGTHQHRTPNKKPLPEPVEPITELLRRAGYFVCNANATMSRAGKSDYNFKFDGKMYDGVDWKQRGPGQPFFAQIQIHEPHRDFVSADDPDRGANVVIPSYYPDHPLVRRDWANYLASIEVLDSHVGSVLERLDNEGLAENTVVIFFGDHGRPHYRDKQWLYDGGIRVPLIVRLPKATDSSVRDVLVSLLDVSATTLALAGVELPEWMHGKDMFADGFAGRDLVFAARDRCGSTVDRIRSVRTKDYKYIRNSYPDRPYWQHSGYKVLQYPGLTVAKSLAQQGRLNDAARTFWEETRPVEELYDLTSDPEELHNVAAQPAYGEIVRRLRSALDDWIQHTGDQGQFAEVGVEAASASSDAWYRSRMKKRGLSPDVDTETYLNWWRQQLGGR